MEDNKLLEKKKEINVRIRKEIFELERSNYRQKTLNSNEIVKKIKRIVEEEVK